MSSQLLDPSQTFSSLADEIGLDVRLRKAVSRLGLVRPTLVQSKCLPLAISSGRDLLVRARTGSGKTLAYCLPLLQKILKHALKDESIKAVILVPTRELCTQVHKTLQALVFYASELVQTAVLSGGRLNKEELARQEAMLRDCPNIVVATPGGLLVHIRSAKLDLKHVETLVVDEADLVLSFGKSNCLFKTSVRSLVKPGANEQCFPNKRIYQRHCRNSKVPSKDLSRISHVSNAFSRVEFTKECCASLSCHS